MTTTALITGATKGIGFQAARLLGGRGMTVLAGTRDAARGQETERALRPGGAEVSVHLATLPADGPSGVLWGYLWTAEGTGSYGILPW